MKAETGYPISRYLNIHSAYHPKYFSDNRHVAFISDITGIPQAWKVKADTDSVCWPEQLTFEAERVQWLACSPVKGDGSLIFGRDVGGNEKAQIYLIQGDDSETCLTEGHGDAVHLPGEWSRDGQSLLFAANRRKPSIFDAYIQHLNGKAELLWENEQPGYIRDLSFSPDGGRVLCSRIQSSFSNQLFEIDIAAKEAREISPTGEEARYLTPCYAHDGESIYLFTDVDSDFLYLARLGLQSLELETVQALGWDVGALVISPDRRFLGYEVNVEGFSELYAMDLKRGETTKVELGETPGVVNGTPVFSPDSSRLAFSYSKATKPLDIYLWDLKTGGIRRATNSSTGGIPPESFSTPELVHYPTFDENERDEPRMIPAWFYKSPEGEKSPVIVLVHGGPESQSRPRFDFRVQYFLNKGYGVFLPNVRGSTGYGKAYSHLDDTRKRMDSVRDLAQGAQWLKEQPNVDGYRIAVMGGSYGGFMVLSAVTVHPDLWAAGIDVVGISNLATFLENTSGYRRRHREAEYGSLKEDREFLESIAPVNHIDNIKAPLMVIQGANDPRVPLSESEQMVKVMREKGKPVDFIVFQDEGHGVVRLKNKRIAYPAMVEFLERQLH
ncbi:MAG: S9 family peptidase [Candidatus Bathyarchaeota archaeon]|nr:S9 family peptidase [Candidatus Bathyarchaeota archaeon]